MRLNSYIQKVVNTSWHQNVTVISVIIKIMFHCINIKNTIHKYLLYMYRFVNTVSVAEFTKKSYINFRFFNATFMSKYLLVWRIKTFLNKVILATIRFWKRKSYFIILQYLLFSYTLQNLRSIQQTIIRISSFVSGTLPILEAASFFVDSIGLILSILHHLSMLMLLPLQQTMNCS